MNQIVDLVALLEANNIVHSFRVEKRVVALPRERIKQSDIAGILHTYNTFLTSVSGYWTIISDYAIHKAVEGDDTTLVTEMEAIAQGYRERYPSIISLEGEKKITWFVHRKVTLEKSGDLYYTVAARIDAGVCRAETIYDLLNKMTLIPAHEFHAAGELIDSRKS